MKRIHFLLLGLLVSLSIAAVSPSLPPTRIAPGANTTILTNGINNFTIISAGGGSGAQLSGTNAWTGTNFFSLPLHATNGLVQAGTAWRTTALPDANALSCVTFGNGLFVATSYDGAGNRVKTSPDGINWTSRTSAADNAWRGITYGNGLFVAVSGTGTGNRVMTSPDGVAWTSRTSAADNNWYSVTYGNGLFVAVSFNGTDRVMTSPDGVTWTSRTAAAASTWLNVTYGNGLFVAVAETTGTMYSSDGITWTSGTSISGRALAYGSGVFVAISAGSSTANYSLDGVSWQGMTAKRSISCVFANGVFVAVSDFGESSISGMPAQSLVQPDNIFQGGLEVRGGLTVGSTGTAIISVLSATAALNYDLTAILIQDLTITVTGAAVGDTVIVGVPNDSVTATVQYTGWVSATDTVTIRARTAAVGENPDSGTFRATVTKF